jgi:nucleoredoxin
MKSRLFLAAAAAFLSLTTLASAGALAESVKGRLVTHQDGKLVKAGDTALEGKKLVAVYYSAHWCPPCRAFTPELSKFYDETKKTHPEFELIFVSSDKSEAAMAEYMGWGKMHWPALAYDQRSLPALSSLSARGIPYLIVLDENGKQLLGKGPGEDWVPPQEILAQLKDLLAGKKA